MSTPNPVPEITVVGGNLQITIPPQSIVIGQTPAMVVTIPIVDIAKALAPYITNAMP